MKKILLVTSIFSEQDSVSTITKNIELTFRTISNIKIKTLPIEHINESFSLKNFDCVAIIHPLVILSPFAESLFRQSTQLNLKIIYFVFGDFVRKSAYLIKHNDLLSHKNIHFVAASSSYLKLVEKCLHHKKDVSLCPFPFDEKKFQFDASARVKFRKKFKLDKNDRAILYTGRISIQKNVEQLIETFIELKQKYTPGKLKLFLIGNVDDFESPTFYNKKLNPGALFQRIKKISSICNSDELFIIPHSDLRFLKEAYNGCDLFVSLSLYHDEDFGYSPLEALACGTPIVCTKWGGFRDFKKQNDKIHSAELINVDFEENFLMADNAEIEKKIKKALMSSQHSKARATFFRKEYSFKSIADQYKKIVHSNASKFGGFSPAFAEFSLKLLNIDTISPRDYEQFYQSFWRK
jgi:glycosyltransferase involved in cell wall biosynthesis